MSARCVPRIKICGITTVEAARAAVEAGADAIGLVRAAGSPRTIDEETADRIRSALPPFVAVVSVFRDGPDDALRSAVAAGDLIQLHGAENESAVAAVGRPVVRGIGFDERELRRWDTCPQVRALLVDGPAAGSGRAFDHGALAALMPRLTRPVILAGGLDPANVADAVRTVRPWAVDVSSGVESAPGVKDPSLIEAFCRAVHAVGADPQWCESEVR